MNLFQLATRGIDLNSLPDESAPERDLLAFEPTKPGSRLAVPQELDAAFQAAGDEYGVDADVLRAMAFAESRFRSDVISGQVKSRTGATGLMQFMPGTAERFGINPLDPVESIFGAAAYMRSNLEKFDGDYGKAVAAYNWGENRKAYDADDWQDRLPAETRGYLDTVFGVADELKLRAPKPTSEATPSAPLPFGVAASTAGAGRGSVSPGMVNTKIPRAAVPDMTFGSVAQDVASGLLQVGPTAVKGVGEVIRLATGDRLGKGVTDFAERGIQATQDMVGSERAAAQRKNFAADMADDSVGLGTALANNKGALADQILPTIGSMFIPVGAAGAAGKLATVGKAARGLNTAALAARVASVQQAAGIGATAAQNAASTFAEMLDKGVPMQEAYTAAGITVPFSLIAGKLTGGGAEGALIKGLSGQNIARGVGEVVKGVLREGAQEGGESLGQVTGEVLGANQDVSLQSGAKRVGTEALLGAVMGGGMNAAQQMVPTVESQPTTPTAPVVPQAPPIPAPPTNRTAAEAADVASQILQAEQAVAPSGLAAELEVLRARSAPAPDFTQRSTTPQAQPGSVPVTGGLAAELQALRTRSSSPQEAANVPQGTVPQAKPTPQGASAKEADVARADAPVPAADIPAAGSGDVETIGVGAAPVIDPATRQPATSWVLRDKSTGAVVMETSQKSVADKINTAKYEAVPIGQHLASLSSPPTAQGATANVPQPAQSGTQASQTPSPQGTTTGARVVLQNRDRSTPSSIAQMRSIAARPDYGRLGFSRDFANGAPVVAGGTIQPAQMGRKDVATASDGRRIPVQYAVVDAGSVLASNTVDGSSNTDYGNGAVQAVRAIAGNGRIAGLQAAYQSGNANAYRQELVQDAALHGIAPEVIAPMANPVLVRVMPDSEVTADIGDISNTVGNLDLSAVEQANNDANRVQLDALQFADDGSITTDAVRQFVRAMPQSEQGQLLDTNGQPTRQAVDRLSAAVFAKAYGNEALTRLYSQAQDPEARLVMSALAQVAPKMARLEGAGALDVRDVVAQAAEIAVNARRQGVPLAKAAQQMDMAADPDVGVVLDLFASNARTVRPVVEALGRMADMAYTEASKPAEDMFGAVPRASRADIINQLRPENERGSQEALEDAAGREPAAVDAERQAAEPAGSAAPAKAQAGRPAEDAAPEGLSSYTPEEVTRRQAEAAQAEATAKRAEDAAARAEAAARQAKEIAQRSAAAADTFELGQSGEDNLSGQGGLKFSRAGDAGKVLNKDQRRAVLETLVDVYKQKNAAREMKGVDRGGNERYGFVYSPDLFEKSDITGAMVRYYVTLPDGRKAHPSELFPSMTASDVESMALKQEEKRQKENAFEAAIKPFYPDFDSANLAAGGGQVVVAKGDRFAVIPERTGAISQARGHGWEIARRGGGLKFSRGTTAGMPENKAPGPQGDAQQGASTGNAVTSKWFTEDNRLSNLSQTGASWQRIRENNPVLRGKSVDDTITVYRATIGDSIRPDDYVAVDKSTLRTELKNVRERDGEAAKIVSMQVQVRDLLMGNDATEFVFFPEQKTEALGTDENTGLPLNADGTVTIYHHTSAAAAAAIRRTGTLKAQAEPDVYVTTHRETDTGYGDTAVAIRIDPARLQIDDEFPNGRKDFRLNVGRPGGSIRVELENEQSAPASQGAINRSFAGARAVTANTHSLVAAQDRLSAGEDPETVRQETGWHRGADGRMRFEISDKDASMKIGRKATPLKSFARDLVRELDRPLRLSDVLDHPTLFAAYPAVADYGVTFVPTEAMPDQARGTYSDGRIMLADDMPAHEALSTLLHEIQHGIQNIEGFATGDSVDRLAGTMPDEKAMNDAKLLARFMAKGESAFDARQRFMRYMGRDPSADGAYMAERYEPDEIARMASTPLDAYKRNAGEVEARNTQARQNMTDAERRATPPGSTADVADSDVIVTFNGKEMQNAPAPANAEQGQAAAKQQPSTPAATIRSAITKAYGKLLGQLESKGLVTLTQTEDEAIDAAAQARADKTGQPLAEVRASLMGSVSNSKRVTRDVRAVLSQADKAGTDVVEVKFGTVDPALAGLIQSKTRKDVGGFEHSMDSSAVRHARNEHGDARQEAARGQIAITDDDLRTAPQVIFAADRYVLGAKDRQGNDLVGYVKQMPDGTVLYVEEVRTGRKTLAFKSIRKYAATSNVDAVAKTLSLNARSDGGISIVDARSLDIKRSANGAIQGFFDPQSGQSFLIADNLTAEAAPGVLMHEVGIHMAADGSMKALFNRAAMMLKLGRNNPFIQRVQSRMDAAGETSAEEAAAYIVTEYENDRANAPASVSKWVQDFIATVRAWLFNKGVLLKADQLTVADIAAVARANARSMARDGGATGGQGFGPAFSRAPAGDQTQTEAFKRWFKDSKVVDADGKPLMVYHGTKADFSRFSLEKFGQTDGGWAGEGFYFAPNPDEASVYATSISSPYGDSTGANVMPVFLSAKNPLEWRLGRDGDRRIQNKRNELGAKEFAKWVQSEGYDSIHITSPDIGNVKGEDQWVVFHPEQVKSAIGNRGTFDPANPDIRFSRAAPTATPPIPTSAQDNLFTPSQSWQLPASTHTDKLIYELQDGRIDLKRVQEAIAATGKQITEGFDARLAETLLPGRIARRTESFLSFEVKPLLESMARNNVSQDELSDYLLARHAPERNAQIAKVNPDMPDGGAGTNSQGVLMTTQAARDHIAALTAGKRTVMELLARQVDALTLGTREILVREGLEKQETVDAWAGAYQHYVPLFKDEAMETPGHPIGAGMSVTGTASKRATGSRGEVTNMVAHILMQREAAITRAEKNRVAMALYGLALTNPNAEMWTTIRPSMPSDQIANELMRMGVDPMEAEVGMQGVPTIRSVDSVSGKVVDRPNPMYKRLDNALVVKVNGEDRVILFNASNKRAARLVQNLKNQDGVLGQLDIAGSIVGKATRYFAAINTQYNPAFGMVNVIRDVGGALVNLTDTQLAGQQARVLSDSIPAMVGIARDLRGDAQRTPWSDLWQQFQDDGGRTGYRDLFIDPYKRADAVQKELETLGKDGKLTPGAAAHAVLDLLDDFNTTLENGVRLAAYKAALDKGLSRAESARLARELTLDFNRKGRLGRELGPLFAFFNASVQGTARTLKALQGPAGKRILAGGLALGVMQALMLAAAGFDDDEIPEFVKARAFIIPLPGKQYIAIPLQFGLNALPNTGRVVTELLMSGGKDWGEKSFNALGELLGSFNPLGGGNIFTGAGALKTIAPTVIDPIVDMATNTDFTGKPIGKERMPWDTRPGFTMGRESTQRSFTGQAYIGISKAINSVTGGNDFAQGLASPSPEEVRYVFTTVGGGVFRELEKALNASVLTAQGESLKAREVPFGSRFAGEVDDQDLQRSRYFKNTARLEKLEAQLKGFSKEGRGEEVRALVKDNPEIRLYELSNQVQSEITKLNKLAGEHINDRETLKRIDAARTTYMRTLNDKVREMERAGDASE